VNGGECVMGDAKRRQQVALKALLRNGEVLLPMPGTLNPQTGRMVTTQDLKRDMEIDFMRNGATPQQQWHRDGVCAVCSKSANECACSIDVVRAWAKNQIINFRATLWVKDLAKNVGVDETDKDREVG